MRNFIIGVVIGFALANGVSLKAVGAKLDAQLLSLKAFVKDWSNAPSESESDPKPEVISIGDKE